MAGHTRWADGLASRGVWRLPNSTDSGQGFLENSSTYSIASWDSFENAQRALMVAAVHTGLLRTP
eukprot:353152-Chlamydomonas_euryale.AAC.9